MKKENGKVVKNRLEQLLWEAEQRGSSNFWDGFEAGVNSTIKILEEEGVIKNVE